MRSEDRSEDGAMEQSVVVFAFRLPTDVCFSSSN